MTPQARAFATPAHRPLRRPKKKNGRPPRLRSMAAHDVRRARGGSAQQRGPSRRVFHPGCDICVSGGRGASSMREAHDRTW